MGRKSVENDLAKGSLADRTQQVEVPEIDGALKVDFLRKARCERQRFRRIRQRSRSAHLWPAAESSHSPCTAFHAGSLPNERVLMIGSLSCSPNLACSSPEPRQSTLRASLSIRATFQPSKMLNKGKRDFHFRSSLNPATFHLTHLRARYESTQDSLASIARLQFALKNWLRVS